MVAYLLYISLGGGAFGWLSGLLHVIEKEENRNVSPSLMWPGFIMLFFGVTASCVSLGYARARAPPERRTSSSRDTRRVRGD